VIERAVNDGEEGSQYWIHTNDPSTQAHAELMKRTIGKPVELAASGPVEIIREWKGG
jgi:hypothetical protein